MSHSPSNPAPDRYLTFVGLDCDRKASTIVERLRTAAANGREDPFWTYFAAKLDGDRGPAHDELYHIHSHLNDLRDLLERWQESDLADLLESIETECC
ncbi:MAG: N(2)-fixation sustaining protein CowN [Thiohalocapsa sp.]|nr:N(2)-fixation sustaining protein CowN [Thiohalocapsa sp.]MCF7992476.1 N(2)-fixation sustaining protein CowN [Thiohalocapsa sp.]